jgi:YVTN family beta-propeller protein
VDVTRHKPLASLTLPGNNIRPMGVVVSPDGSRIFVATGHGGRVVAIDSKSRTVVGDVAVGKRPWGLALSPDGRLLYAANGLSNTVSIVDAQALELLGEIPVGNRPWGIAIGIAAAAP